MAEMKMAEMKTQEKIEGPNQITLQTNLWNTLANAITQGAIREANFIGSLEKRSIHKRLNDMVKDMHPLPEGDLLEFGSTSRFESIENLTPKQREYFSGVVSFSIEEYKYWQRILDPETLDKVVTRLTGGKGKNSFEMIMDGKNVPPFESITTNVYFELLNQLETELKKIFEPANKNEYTKWSYTENNLKIACNKAEHLWMNISLPEVIENNLKTIYEKLAKLGLLCSRSSGDKEDGAKTSIAGRNESYLAIPTYEIFRQATLATFASQWGIDSVRYALDNGFDLFKGGISVIEQVYAAPTHCAVGFSFENGIIKLNVAEGMGETLAKGGTSTAEVMVHPEMQISDLDNWNWQPSKEDENYYVLIKNGKKLLEINIPIQNSAYLVNPEANSYLNTTYSTELGKRLDINVIKQVLNRLILQMKDITAKNGGAQDCEFPINLNTNTIFNAQKRPNTSSLETIEGMPKKPNIEQKPIFKGTPVGDGARTGRLIILDVKKVYNTEIFTEYSEIAGFKIPTKVYQPGKKLLEEKLVDSKGNDITPNSIQGDEIFVCQDGTAISDGFLTKNPFTLYRETSTTAHSPLLLAGEWGGLGIIINNPNAKNGLELLKSLGLKENDIITIDNEGNIYKGEIPELVKWQEEVDVFLLQRLLEISKTELKQNGLTVGYNASSLEAAQLTHSKVGYFTNCLIRMEKLVGKRDISDIANFGTEKENQNYIDKVATEIAEIVKLTKETTLRFSGACGAERTGEGVPKEAKENPSKQGVNQGVRENLRDLVAFEFEAKIITRVIELLGNQSNKLMIMGQFTRTAVEFKEWKDKLIEFGIDENKVSIGSMAEVPSLTFDFEALAKFGCKFVSVGTNDFSTLLQSVDGRINPSGSDIIAEKYPAIGRPIIRGLIYMGEQAKKYGIKIKLCGGILGKYPDLAPYLEEWGYISAPVENTKQNLKTVNNLIEAKDGLPPAYFVNV